MKFWAVNIFITNFFSLIYGLFKKYVRTMLVEVYALYMSCGTDIDQSEYSVALYMPGYKNTNTHRHVN